MSAPEQHAAYAAEYLARAAELRTRGSIIDLCVSGDCYWKAIVQAAQAAESVLHPADDVRHIRGRNEIRNIIGRINLHPNDQARLRSAVDHAVWQLHGASYAPHRLETNRFDGYAEDAGQVIAAMLRHSLRR